MFHNSLMRTRNMTFERQLENVEAAAWADFYRAAPVDVAERLAIRLIESDDATSLNAANIDVLAVNRVINLGIRKAVTEDRLDEFIVNYVQAGTPRFFVSLPPTAQPPGLASLLEQRGLSYYNNWVKLYRGVEPPPPIKSRVGVRRTDANEADTFGTICGSCFGWPEECYSWIAATVGRPGWHHYLAYDGPTPVATGGLFVLGEYGWISFASTLPEARGRGAQAALVAQRLADAAKLGCKHIVVETAEQTPERDAPSYRNMIRFGFREAYKRPNYIMVLSQT
jgi:hypothetical protein